MQKGISLIVLIISIIVIIVLAGAVIISVNGTGIIERAQKSKLLTEIREIQELINIEKSMNPDKNYDFGSLTSIIEIEENNKYNNVLYMENGKLVYNKDSVTSKQAEWLEEEGIIERQNVIPIYTLEQFEKIASGSTIEIGGIEYTFKANATYNLQNDIDFGGSAENVNKTISSFSGVLDGRGYTLSNIYIVGSGNKALFAKVTSGGKIKKINLKDCYIETTSYSGVALLVRENKGEIQNVFLEGTTVKSANNHPTSGIVDKNYGLIENCSTKKNNIITKTNDWSATVVNENYGKIKNCFNKEHSTSRGVHFVNYNMLGGTIENCYNLASTTANGYPVGICNSNSGTIINCYNMGDLNGPASYYSSRNS